MLYQGIFPTLSLFLKFHLTIYYYHLNMLIVNLKK